jgi:hypothetical protein
MLYQRATTWLCTQRLERAIALIAFVFALPSLANGLQSDDYLLREQVLKDGPFAAYVFTARGEQASHAQVLEHRRVGHLPWWTDEYPKARFFRPLTSLSLWLDFQLGAPPWWMHLENCVIYAVIAWLAAMIYRQLGLSGAGLGWAALFFALDMAFATPVGWISARNTLLATCFGLACIALHDRARRNGSALQLAAACLSFVLSLLSGELGLCTLGYLTAHALFVDRNRMKLALTPYAALTVVYLSSYVAGDYGVSNSASYIDVIGAPGSALLTFLTAIPVWLATTATLPVAGFQMISPETRIPIAVGSVVVLVLLIRLLASSIREQPTAAGLFGIGALLSLLPLATVMPQERLRFFVALGVYGLLGPWIARDFSARALAPRLAARAVWSLHGIILPLFFIPSLFATSLSFATGGARALDEAVPRATEPITIILNPPSFYGPIYQEAMRAARAEPRPPVYMLYAGSQSLHVTRPNPRSLELHAPQSWFASQFDGFRDLTRWPFRVGERIELAHFTVEVLEVDARGAPTRARITFDRDLEAPTLTFLHWSEAAITPWTPPPVGTSLQLSAAAVF